MTALLPPAPENFTSRLRSAAVAARVGVWLGACFGICFLTGLVSHYAQDPGQPLGFLTSPSWGYRVTQGLHVITGTAAIPLLLVKLWSVYPRLFERLPSLRGSQARTSVQALRPAGTLVVNLLERASIAALVASAVFQLTTGLLNTTQWLPWDFSFRRTHYAVAWIAIGSLLVHIAVKLPITRAVLRADVDDTAHDRPTATQPGALSRRGLLRATWVAAGVAVLATAGATVPLLRKVSVLGVRSGEGPQGVPINKSAVAAGVTETAVDPTWVLEVTYGDTTERLARADLLAMEQRTESLPIACVEGWSASATWTGVRLRDVLDLVGAPSGRDVYLRSLQESGPFRSSVLQSYFADDDRTLLALQLHGEDLHLDHGYPCRLIAPNRPGVLQTKWLASVDVT